MKALFLTIDFPPMGGGMSRHSLDVVMSLKQEGFCPFVIAPEADSPDTFENSSQLAVRRLKGIRPENIFDNYAKSAAAFFFLGLRHCLRNNVSVILANSWTIAGVAAFLLSKLLGIPYIVFSHGLELNNPQNSKKVNFLMRLILRNAACVVASSAFTKDLIEQKAADSKVKVLNPGLDLERLPHYSQRPQENEFYGKKILLTVSRIVEHKGHDMVIRALPDVLKQFPDTIYIIVGNGPRQEYLKKLAGDLGVRSQVIFKNNLKNKELFLYYSLCDIFIMMSRQIPEQGEVEGFGIVFLEAAAYGKPAIAGKSGGIGDAVLDGVTGILVAPCDIKAVSSAIIKLLSDNDLRQKLGANARKRVEEEFNLGRFAGSLREIINEASANKK